MPQKSKVTDNPFAALDVALSSEATKYLASLSAEYERARDVRKRGGFTLAEAARATGLTKPSLRARFEAQRLKSEICYDPQAKKQTRFYFPA